MQMARTSYTCDCNFSSFRHLTFHTGFDPICSYTSAQKSCKVPCLFGFLCSVYLALLLHIYLFPTSLPSFLFLFLVTVTDWKTGVRFPEHASISAFFTVLSRLYKQTKLSTEYRGKFDSGKGPRL